jgi:hypothetical protein
MGKSSGLIFALGQTPDVRAPDTQLKSAVSHGHRFQGENHRKGKELFIAPGDVGILVLHEQESPGVHTLLRNNWLAGRSDIRATQRLIGVGKRRKRG